MTGIANWCEWKWPIEGPNEGSICARALPNFGSWNVFPPSKIQKIVKTRIFEKPIPTISTHTQPKDNWTVKLPRNSGIILKSASFIFFFDFFFDLLCK